MDEILVSFVRELIQRRDLCSGFLVVPQEGSGRSQILQDMNIRVVPKFSLVHELLYPHLQFISRRALYPLRPRKNLTSERGQSTLDGTETLFSP